MSCSDNANVAPHIWTLAGAFGLVYEGIFIPEEGVVIKVAVKTMRGV